MNMPPFSTRPLSRPHLAPHALFLLTFGLVLITGLGGIDYGIHWDEFLLQASITWSIQHRTFLPEGAFYPSICNSIGLFAMYPEVVSRLIRLQWPTREFISGLEALSKTPVFLIRV